MKTIAERLESASDSIRQLCQSARLVPEQVKLLAVSKTKPIEDIRQAYAAGQCQFGENYVQEGVEKIQALRDLPDIEWHFIGPLQSNKTRAVAEHFDWMQSLDRLKIARRLNEQRPDNMPALNVLIQINISHDERKSGLENETELFALAEQIDRLPNLSLRGVMAIPSAGLDDAQQLAIFMRMRRLFDGLQARFPQADTLSMGMSGDMHNAIKAGSTMVRLGTAIFGARGNSNQMTI
ncbi:YggS family pyridoxal phosphate-dependent enzyme [Lacimicrobium alkaliphilum]|uniref:Pyridoxal phosphate homeostasis protein n=1 Tax=Lacimicrobium alkaliphilum TaxID=1526571 RepID=A0ABQ1QZV0_9ALTE|nr:YggS family pyridoxal phosphate-dependent enzyme [Lacimicrobium alkaliphilum]GGD49475.1 YggS family pyridoxal phosphate enzyme [Lacimicrobium alkaliphilum]